MENSKIFAVSVVTRPLMKHRYSFKGNEMEVKERNSAAEPPKEEIYSHLTEEPAETPSLELQSQGTTAEEDGEDVPAKKKRIRRLKKEDFSLFEDVIDEKAILEEKVNQMINQDHYYDVVPPYDQENQVQIHGRNKRDNRIIIILFALMAVIVGLLAWMIGDLVS